MANEGRVWFILCGTNVDPEIITSALGINPTDVNVRGNEVNWIFSSDRIIDTTEDILDIMELADRLIQKLTPVTGLIQSVTDKYELTSELSIEMWITGDDEQSTPIAGLDSRVIAFMSDVGASLDIDTYRN